MKVPYPGLIAIAVFAALLALALWWSPPWLYAWLKVGHIVAVVSWMAGMLYLPRLFVYHAAAEPGFGQSETFKVMERRLLRGIMNPAAIGTWGFGLSLGWLGNWFGMGWLDTKIGLVIAMTGIHAFLAYSGREFAEDRNVRPQRFWRILNEVPTLLLILIVILVVVKPY